MWPFDTGQAPDIVNARGDTINFNGGDFNKELSLFTGTESSTKNLDVFLNWLTGNPKLDFDPSKALTQAASMSPLYQKAGAGMGMAGLFGLGRVLGGLQSLNLGPMQAGVPYSASPLPKLIDTPAPGGLPGGAK